MTFFFPDNRIRIALVALVCGSGLCLALLAARIFFSHSWALSFYPWNLLLAWIPMLLAAGIYTQSARESGGRRLLVLCALMWFFFFPNAPYIVTDLIHLRAREPVPKWFDVVMMASFAWTGLFLGYFSLHLMQEVVRARWGTRWGWRFAVLMLAASSFGIYLGRFERWNSWDVLTRPFGIASDVVRHTNFVSNPEALAFSATFFAFSLISYLPLIALIHLRNEGLAEKPADAAQVMQ